jgi:exopolysaccharide production protein ExoF
MRSLRVLGLVAAIAGAAVGDVTPATAADFVLGPGDKLSITVHRRTDLSGEFRVLPGGAVSLPFLGNLSVAGQTPEQVSAAVTQRLRDEASLLDPRVSVEIAEMQPILVAGPVRRPGQYPFQLGMTVGHALAAAGGTRRLELEETGVHVEIARLRERLRQGQDSYGLALLRRARWSAEAEDATAFEAPAEAALYLPRDRLQQTLESERQLLSSRSEIFNSLLAMLRAQTAALNDEIQALQENATAKAREQELLQEETRYVDSLMRRGLAPRTSRVIELARLAVQVDGERRQILSFMARARQEIARVEHTRVNAVRQRQLEAGSGMKDAEDQLATLQITLQESRSGLLQLRESLPAEAQPLGAPTAAAIAILRIRATPPQRIAADADTPLLPGDLVHFAEPAAGGDRLALAPQR